MTLRALDKVRQDAEAKERRLDAAFKIVDSLTADEKAIVYARLARHLEATLLKRPGRPAGTTKPPTVAKKKVRKPTATDKPKYSDLAEQMLKEHPEGLRTYEIGKEIGQPTPSAFGTLKLLERQGRAERHGSRATALWTLPGLKPVARIETVDAAIIHLLTNIQAPLDGRKLRDDAARLLAKETGRKVIADTVANALSRLVSKGTVARRGANEHGPMYVLSGENGGDEAPTLN